MSDDRQGVSDPDAPAVGRRGWRSWWDAPAAPEVDAQRGWSGALAPAPTPAAGGAATWTPDQVPWGWSRPPALRPILLPPGRFHPGNRRNPLSPAGRASPLLYLLGLVLGLPGLLALVWVNVASWFGVESLAVGPLPGLVIVEVACALAVAGAFAAATAQVRQRRADGWHDYAGPSPLVALLALVGLVTGLGAPLAGILESTGLELDSASATLLVVLLYLACYAGVVHLLVVVPRAMSWRDILRPSRLAPDADDWALSVPWSALGRAATSTAGSLRQKLGTGLVGDLLLGVAMVPLALIASNLTNLVLLLVLGLDSADISSPGPATPDAIDMLIALLAVAVIVPLGEEIFFRGFATNAWGRSLARSRVIWQAGLLFAAIHVLNVTSTVPDVAIRAALFNFGARIPVAILLGWIYMRRRSLLASAALHGGYNGLIVILALGLS